MLVGIGLYIRARLDETPVFDRVRHGEGAARLPLLDALREYPLQILLASGSIISTGAYWYILTTYSLSYGTTAKTFTRPELLTAVLLGAAVAIVALPWFGARSQVWGRRRMILIGLAAMAVWIFPTMLALDTGNPVLLVGAFVVATLLFSISYGPQATFIVEMFDARVRFSAASTSFQIGVLLGGALAPIIAAALVASTGTVLAVAGYVAALSLLSLACVAAVSAASLARGSADLDSATSEQVTAG